jgi:uncharacterized protein YbbK (DUF523 family)
MVSQSSRPLEKRRDRVIMVSSCLWGEKTRYDGSSRPHSALIAHLTDREVMLVCPEVWGGLTVPRSPAVFTGARLGREGHDLLTGRARLINGDGQDVSCAFIKGAREVLRLALAGNVEQAYLKDRSPSCAFDPLGLNPEGGVRMGVLSALLTAHHIAVREVRSLN